MHYPAANIDAEEAMCMVTNVYYETTGEPISGQTAAAHLVLERANDPRYPDTICNVVKQRKSKRKWRCSFSWYCDGKPDTIKLTRKDGSPIKENTAAFIEVAISSLDAMTGASLNPCPGANFYYNPKIANPRWSKIYTPVCEIGQHSFLRREYASLL